MMKTMIAIILLISQVALAETAYERASDQFWRISFDNPPGPLGTGLCWWHSRLQRSIIYLAEMAPEMAKPTDSQAREIIKKLIKMDSVVTIPGYMKLNAFTYDYRSIIEDELGKWQLHDALVNQAWTRGLFGVREKSPVKAKAHLDELYKDFLKAKQSDEILWIKLQKKPGAHSFLLLGMSPNKDHTGYEMQTIDSTYSTGFTDYVYEKDASFIRRVDLPNETSIPSVGFDRDMTSIKKALLKHQQGLK